MPADPNYPTDETSADRSGPGPEPAAEEKMEGETFLAPKSAFYGKDMKAGSKETVEVVHVYDDEYELKCLKEGAEEAAEPESMQAAQGQLDTMATEA